MPVLICSSKKSFLYNIALSTCQENFDYLTKNFDSVTKIGYLRKDLTAKNFDFAIFLL